MSSFATKGYAHVLGFNEAGQHRSVERVRGDSDLSVARVPRSAHSGGHAGNAGEFDGPDVVQGLHGAGQRRPELASGLHRHPLVRLERGFLRLQASQLESYIRYAEGFAGGRPIWLTEWGCLNQSAPTAQGVVDFYAGALAVFADHPRVQRYAWYPWSTNCGLNDSDGKLTPLGIAYAAAAAYR